MLLQQCEVKLLIYSKILFFFFCFESYILKGVVGYIIYIGAVPAAPSRSAFSTVMIFPMKPLFFEPFPSPDVVNHPESCDLQSEEFPKRVRLLPSVAKKERLVVARQVRKHKSASCPAARCAMS